MKINSFILILTIVLSFAELRETLVQEIQESLILTKWVKIKSLKFLQWSIKIFSFLYFPGNINIINGAFQIIP